MSAENESRAARMRKLIDLTRKYWRSEGDEVPYLDEVYVTAGEKSYLLEGRKWVSGRFDRNIGIDAADYGVGTENAKHAHIYGRKGNELGVVRADGTSSHGSKFRLHADDAEALRARGFQIPDDRIVEWVSLNVTDVRFLLEG